MAKAEKTSEVEAMGFVDNALSGLEPDARQRVMDWAAAKYALDAAMRRTDLKSSEQQRIQEIQKPETQKPKDIKTFLTQKKPVSMYERVACLAYYLEKFDGATEFKTADIGKANSDARLSRMSNAALFIKHATHTYGYLTSLGGRKFALSSRGEAVVEALPDRAKVEQAHIDHPLRGRAKSRKKSKSTNK